jgi:GntR family transcriptional regulator
MKLLTIDPASQTPIYVQIMDQIRAQVRDAVLMPETPLPAVRQLAGDLEINPNTVAKAYALLEQEGVLRTRERRGVFVAPAGAERASDAADRRMEEAIDRVVEEGRSLGLNRNEILDAVARRLGGADSSGGVST